MAFRGVVPQKEASEGGEEQWRMQRRQGGVCVPWESRVSSMVKAGGIYREK